MNKKIFLSILLVLVIVLTSCTAANISATSTTTAQSDSELSQATELALGTIQLDQTAYAVDADQAAELLTLWKAARALSQSDTTAQVEINALLKQIQNTLSADQLAALEGMSLTAQDISAAVSELGVYSMASSGSSSETTAPQTSGQSGNMAAGPMPGGGDTPPDQMTGGAPTGSGAEMQPASSTGSSVNAGAMLEIGSNLLNALIQFLQTRAAQA